MTNLTKIEKEIETRKNQWLYKIQLIFNLKAASKNLIFYKCKKGLKKVTKQ